MPSFLQKNQLHKIILILDNLRSVHNSASLFRLADSIGVLKVICVGTTPTPLDRFSRIRPDFKKVSLGSENISWEYYSHISEIIPELKNEGFSIIAIEQVENSIDYKAFVPKNKSCIILSNEPCGISSEAISLSDVFLEIPQYGDKESLNVVTAGAIVLYSLFDI